MRWHIFQLTFLEHGDDFIGVNGQVGHGINSDDGGSGISVDEAIAISLPKDMQNRRLVEVPQLGQVFNFVKGGRIGQFNIVLFDL